ncbi:hypothetical protein ACJJTC_000074 [Scirpophaga incertulas]
MNEDGGDSDLDNISDTTPEPRELDMEEDLEDDTGEERQFDISLAATHSYMGGLEVVRRRRLLETGWRGSVPVVAHHGAVFPGETVPLLLPRRAAAGADADAVQRGLVFGLLCPDAGGALVSGYGALCEVLEVGQCEEGGLQGAGASAGALAFKARAARRFRFADMPRRRLPVHHYASMRKVEVVVLPELCQGPALAAAGLRSLDSRRGRLQPALRRVEAALSPWPALLYEMFDLAAMRRHIAEFFTKLRLDKLPEDPISLSFWVASNLAAGGADRLQMLVADCAVLRLALALRLMAKKSQLCCSSCLAEIAVRDHIIPMSSEGVHANYTNLGGYMHDVVTVSAVRNTRLQGRASAEYSWFPGYCWTIAVCGRCSTHVGWRYCCSTHVGWRYCCSTHVGWRYCCSTHVGWRAAPRPSTPGSPATAGPSPCAAAAARTWAGGTAAARTWAGGTAAARTWAGGTAAARTWAGGTAAGGYMHDVVTVSAVRNTRLQGRASAEYSWFPGYCWTIAVCGRCSTHVGWRYCCSTHAGWRYCCSTHVGWRYCCRRVHARRGDGVGGAQHAAARAAPRPSTPGSPATAGPSPCAAAAARTWAGGTAAARTWAGGTAAARTWAGGTAAARTWAGGTAAGGYMHDVVTVSAVRNTRLQGRASAEYSWFPGYCWTIAVCGRCSTHVGWRYCCSTHVGWRYCCSTHVGWRYCCSTHVGWRYCCSTHVGWRYCCSTHVGCRYCCSTHVGWRYCCSTHVGWRAAPRPSTPGSPATAGPSPCAAAAARTWAGGTAAARTWAGGTAAARTWAGGTAAARTRAGGTAAARTWAGGTAAGGYMHDVVTVSAVRNTRLQGRASAEYSWFPGYCWTIAVCGRCSTHVGWRYCCSTHVGWRYCCSTHVGWRYCCSTHVGWRYCCSTHVGWRYCCSTHAGWRYCCSTHVGWRYCCRRVHARRGDGVGGAQHAAAGPRLGRVLLVPRLLLDHRRVRPLQHARGLEVLLQHARGLEVLLQHARGLEVLLQHARGLEVLLQAGTCTTW